MYIAAATNTLLSLANILHCHELPYCIVMGYCTELSLAIIHHCYGLPYPIVKAKGYHTLLSWATMLCCHELSILHWHGLLYSIIIGSVVIGYYTPFSWATIFYCHRQLTSSCTQLHHTYYLYGIVSSRYY